MAWNDNLTGIPLEIASFPGTPLRVIAGPGTGKTSALMRRIARLLEEGVTPRSVLAVSFTRTAANDLVVKLSKLGVSGASSVIARTLHSLCFYLLNESEVFKVTNRIPRPLLQFEIDCLVSDLALAFGGRDATNVLLKAFEAYWARLQHLEPGWPKDKRDEKFQRELKNWLIFHGCILVGELVPLTIDFIKQNPASPLIPNYSHVLADEYQDLNRADQELIDLLAARGQLTVVGDEDQSIYSFLRFAHPEGITKFHETHTGTQDKQLDICFRCPKKVVDMAKALILHNSRTKTAAITYSNNNPPGEVHIVQHNNFSEEAANLSAFVDWYLKENPEVKPGEVLILATRRPLGYSIRDELIRLDRPAQSFFNEECLESITAREGFCLLNLLVKPNDKSALRAWLGVDIQSQRSPAYMRLMALSKNDGLSPKEYLEALLAGQKKIPHGEELVKRYEILKQKLNVIASLNVSDLIDALWPARDQGCLEIRSFALAVSQKSVNPSELLGELMTIIVQPVLPGEDDGIIRVMSLHKSKGLTAKCVMVAGCVAGALPFIKPKLGEKEVRKTIEEQRRLFYVALTRTTKTLVISSAAIVPFKDAMAMNLKVIKIVGPDAILQPSPFLSELGNHGVKIVSGLEWRKNHGF